MTVVKSGKENELLGWVERWKAVGPQLENLRQKQIRNTNTIEAIKSFELAFKSALRNTPAKSASGLVEFQRLVAGLSKR